MDPELLERIRAALIERHPSGQGYQPGPGLRGFMSRLSEAVNPRSIDQRGIPWSRRGVPGVARGVLEGAQRNPGEFALDVTPGVGDAKAVFHDAPELFDAGHPWLGSLAVASALPVVGVVPDLIRTATNTTRALPTPRVPEGAPEMLRARHYGPQAGTFETIDPNFQGTGQRGAERARAAEEGYLPRSYLYGPDAVMEPRFRGQPMAETDIPKHLIATPEDQKVFLDEAVRQIGEEGGTGGLHTRMENLIRQQGFEAYMDASGAIAKFTPSAVRAGVTGGGVRRVARLAEDYAKEAGIPLTPQAEYLPLDQDLGRRVADTFVAATHAPNDPAVRASYDAFKAETKAQYEFLASRGVKFEPWTQSGQPYETSAEMIADVRDNNRIKFFLTEEGFGAGDDATKYADHPLLERTGVMLGGREMTYNDLFRGVHGYFGHAKEGVQFGPRGEFNAANVHSAMFSEAARPAMLWETHGQNSWVNFGPQMRGLDGRLLKEGDPGYRGPKERDYAPPKANILPLDMAPPAAFRDRRTAPGAERAGGLRASDPLADDIQKEAERLVQADLNARAVARSKVIADQGADPVTLLQREVRALEGAPAVLPPSIDRPLFDLSPAALERSFIEDVVQKPIDYQTVARGRRLDRIRARFTPERRRQLIRLADEMRSQSPSAQWWYATEPLRARYIGELGEAAGIDAFNLFMRRVAATSPRTKIYPNVVAASQNKGRLKSHRGLLSRANAGEPFGPGAPKVTSFDGNLVGNRRPLTGDVHFTDVVGGPKPTADVYGEYDRLFSKLAEEAGYNTADLQATIWIAGTNVSEVTPFLGVVDRAVANAARRQGVSKEQAFRRFIRGEETLGGIVAAAVGTEMVRRGGDREER
jgi:hypothetical protein